MQDYLTAEEAAKLLGIDYFTFLARVRAGRYAFEKMGKAYFFKKSVIEKAALAESQ